MGYDGRKSSCQHVFATRAVASSALPDRLRHRHATGSNGFVRMRHQLTAQEEGASLEEGLHFMQVDQSPDDLGPFPSFSTLAEPSFQIGLEQQRKETAEHLAADGFVALVVDGARLQDRFGGANLLSNLTTEIPVRLTSKYASARPPWSNGLCYSISLFEATRQRKATFLFR